MPQKRSLYIKNSFFTPLPSKSYNDIKSFTQSQRKKNDILEIINNSNFSVSQPVKLKKLASPKELISGIFELYGVGINYNSYIGMGLPYGSGFLISENLILTTHRNIPTYEHAVVSLLKFIQRPEFTYRLSPNKFFYTDLSKNITIAAISTDKPLHPTKAIKAKAKFTLFKNETLKILTPDVTPCKIANVFKNTFTFNFPGYLLPGTPVFNDRLKLQGIFVSNISEIAGKEAIRIDAIFEHLVTLRNIILHPDLENLITGASKGNGIVRLSNNRLGDCRDLFWVQKRSCSIFHYRHLDRSWSSLQIVNITEFKGRQEKWNFKEYTRVVYGNDGSLFIIGGMDPDTATSVTENIQLYPSSGILQKKASMQEGRSAHCLVYRLGYIYAIGGYPLTKTCERYNIGTNKWEPISSLITNRGNSSAILFNHESQILIVGGDADAASSIERYSFQFDKWELLSVELPGEFINPGLYLNDNNKVAIFGGKSSELIIVLEADSYVRERVAHEVEEVFRVYTVDVLPCKLVCVYPYLFIWGKNVVYFINDRYESKPDIFEYSVKRLGIEKATAVKEFKNISKVRSYLPDNQRLLTPSFHDMYY